MFVDYTKDGELASSMRELAKRLSDVTEFSVKVVERAGTSLKEQFPTTNLWDESSCGREDCTKCNQGSEELPNCKKASLVYENVCVRCNLEAGKKGELDKIKDDTPAVYIGETCRTVYERSKEHWGAWRSGKEESHQETDHGGDGSPKFMMRVVTYHKSALSRQIGEAVRIGRRGVAGMVQNSKSEFNRCRMPRLIIEEIDEKQIQEVEERELRIAMEHLNRCEVEWELDKTRKREQELKEARRKLEKIESKIQSRKREQDGYKGAEVDKRWKKLKYNVEEEGWGKEQVTPAPNTMQLQGATTPPQPSPQKEEGEKGRGCRGATLRPGSHLKSSRLASGHCLLRATRAGRQTERGKPTA